MYPNLCRTLIRSVQAQRRRGEVRRHPGGSHDWERQLVERGKWSPVKTYRKVWKNGIAGAGDWSLKLRLTARDSSIEPLTQRAYVIVTVEGLDESQPVYQDGLAAVARLRYPSALAVDATRLRVGNQP